MNKKAGLFLSAIVIVVALAVGFTIGLKYNNNSNESSSLVEENSQLKEKISQLESQGQEDRKLKICPDEWINNQQPIAENNESINEEDKQYFILNKERRELEEFDMNWIIQNCDIKITTVY